MNIYGDRYAGVGLFKGYCQDLNVKTDERELEVWPETRFSPSRRFLNVDWRCNSGFLKRIAYTTMPYKTGLRLLGVARNPANGFPARLLGIL